MKCLFSVSVPDHLGCCPCIMAGAHVTPVPHLLLLALLSEGHREEAARPVPALDDDNPCTAHMVSIVTLTLKLLM